jgi:ABC-type Fe3+/spermidine/putrescine transport system ATPase subunit
MSDWSIEARHLVKRHGATMAVDHVSLDIRRGEFFSILGPSGAGKTSILRMLAGFEWPDSGEIFIEGRSMANVPPNRRPVNLVFQSYALFPHLTVFENVSFGLEMQRVAKLEISARVQAALEMVKLSGKHYRLPAQLSGGEQQRVALARALVNRPAVVLLDEPLAALDQQLRREMQSELKAIQEQVGITFVCVTHHQEEALTMSDRVAVMDHGRVFQVGRPQEIYETPSCLSVARFMGASNELIGVVRELEQGEALIDIPELGDARPPVRVPKSPELRIGSRLTLLVRPERLHLSSDTYLPGFSNQLQVRVEKAFYSGSDRQYVLCLSQGIFWKASIPNAGADQKRFAPGERLFVRWKTSEGVVLTS